MNIKILFYIYFWQVRIFISTWVSFRNLKLLSHALKITGRNSLCRLWHSILVSITIFLFKEIGKQMHRSHQVACQTGYPPKEILKAIERPQKQKRFCCAWSALTLWKGLCIFPEFPAYLLCLTKRPFLHPHPLLHKAEMHSVKLQQHPIYAVNEIVH